MVTPISRGEPRRDGGCEGGLDCRGIGTPRTVTTGDGSMRASTLPDDRSILKSSWGSEGVAGQPPCPKSVFVRRVDAWALSPALPSDGSSREVGRVPSGGVEDARLSVGRTDARQVGHLMSSGVNRCPQFAQDRIKPSVSSGGSACKAWPTKSKEIDWAPWLRDVLGGLYGPNAYCIARLLQASQP